MSASKKLINDPRNVVPESVEGLLLSNSALARVGGLNVVVRRDIETYKAEHVTVISGGGSGHEPAHAGFIGAGMLSGAVLGNVFASPSVSMILAAVRTCTGPKGCLLVVKNYTGDRLNFGMAMEKAKAEGLQVRMVIVADDAALPEGKGITGGRGVAGTIFVHKIAGASAASGATLEEVTAAATAAAAAVTSMGVALTTCTVPGAPPSTRLDEKNKYEVGLGIHGEPGRETRYFVDGATDNADSVGDTLVAAVCERGRLGSGVVGAIITSFFASPQPVAVLLNNLGALPAIELYVVARRVVKSLRARGLAPVRIFVGAFMTALEMSGLSLTVFKTSPEQLALLDAHTSAPAWVPAAVLDGLGTVCSVAYEETAFQKDISGGAPCPGASKLTAAVAQAIIAAEPELTRCDAICGDGDCGIVMKAGAERLLALAGSGELLAAEGDAALFCDRLATAISGAMGGTSGALLELFFRAAANSLAQPAPPAPRPRPEATTLLALPPSSGEPDGDGSGGSGSGSREADWAAALQAGLGAMAFYGGASPGMRTMLDALAPAVEAFAAAGGSAAGGAAGASVAGGAAAGGALAALKAAAEAAAAGAEATKTMGGLAGRSNYVNEEAMRGVADPGALAVATAFAAAAAALE